MANNTTLNTGTGGDTIRDIDKSGIKTPVSVIDIGGSGAESLLVSGQAAMAGSVPVVIASNQTAVSVDTELPAAAALTDTTANPTVPGVAGFIEVFNGTTWDRMPGNTSGAFSQGNVANAAADAGNPLKIGGKIQTAVPGAGANGNRVDAYFESRGRLGVVIGSGSGDVNSTTPSNDATITSGLNGLFVLAQPHLWNDTSTRAERQRNNLDISLLASAARTATTSSADQINYNGRGVMVFLNVTVASGSGGLTLTITWKDSISANYVALNAAPTAVTATGQFLYVLYPGIGTAAGGVTQNTSQGLPRTWRATVTHGDASSYTYSVSGVTLL